MASQRQRDAIKKRAEYDEEPDLFDLDVEETDTVAEDERAVKAAKSPLHLVLMLVAEDFPLAAGQALYVNTGTKHPLGEMVLRADGRIETSDGVKDSATRAALVYQPWRLHAGKKGQTVWPDGWDQVKVADRAKVGKYISLNNLFGDYWRTLGVEIEVLESDDRLAVELEHRGVDSDLIKTLRLTRKQSEEA